MTRGLESVSYFCIRAVASAAAILADVEKQGIPVAGARRQSGVDVDRYSAALGPTVDRGLDVLAAEACKLGRSAR